MMLRILLLAIVAGSAMGAFFVDHSLLKAPLSSGSRRVFVKYREGTLNNSRFSIQSNPKIKRIMQIDHLDLGVVSGLDSDIEELGRDPNVLFIEEDRKRYPLGEVDPWGVLRIKSNFAWEKGFDGSGVKICIIDSGIRISHEEFAGSTRITGQKNTNWNEDLCGHGSHIAGTIAARKGNNAGVVGVAPGAQLHIVKVFHGKSCSYTYSSGFIAALQECANVGSKIISMSLGGRIPLQSELEIFNSLFAQGILSVASAGNGGMSGEYNYPASYDSVISVASTTRLDRRSEFSQVNNKVNIAAPGEQILSVGVANDVDYMTMSGTSMAVPHVSAVAALLWSAFPSASNLLIRKSLEESADDVGPKGWDPYVGHGIVNVNSAYNYLEAILGPNEEPPSPSQSPSPAPSEIDTTPLVIVGKVRVNHKTELLKQKRFLTSSATFSWITNKPSYSRICFSSASESVGECFDASSETSTNHTVEIHLNSGTYMYTVVSFISGEISNSLKGFVVFL